MKCSGLGLSDKQVKHHRTVSKSSTIKPGCPCENSSAPNLGAEDSRRSHGPDSGHAHIRAGGGGRHVYPGSRFAEPAQSHGDQACAGAGGAAAREAAQPHHPPRDRDTRRCGLLRPHGAAADRPGRHRGQHDQRARQPARAAAHRRGHVSGAVAHHSAPGGVPCPLPGHPGGPGRERPHGGSDRGQRGLRDPGGRTERPVTGGTPHWQPGVHHRRRTRLPGAQGHTHAPAGDRGETRQRDLLLAPKRAALSAGVSPG